MKHLFILILLLSTSCSEDSGNQKVSEDDLSVYVDGFKVVVTTDFLEDGCEVLLQIEKNGEQELLLPVELDDQYKVHGLELLITYHSSRIMQSNCQMGRPIVIEEIKLVE